MMNFQTLARDFVGQQELIDHVAGSASAPDVEIQQLVFDADGYRCIASPGIDGETLVLRVTVMSVEQWPDDRKNHAFRVMHVLNYRALFSGEQIATLDVDDTILIGSTLPMQTMTAARLGHAMVSAIEAAVAFKDILSTIESGSKSRLNELANEPRIYG